MASESETPAAPGGDSPEQLALWARYRDGDRAAYEALVDSYLPLVKATVSRMAVSLPPQISRDDLFSAGCFGLVAAVERYDPSHDARFRTYAITRIRGAILDELRSHDVLGRVTRERLTRIHRATADLQNQGKEADPETVAQEAGLTLDEYWDAEAGALASRRVSLHETPRDHRFSLADTLTESGSASPSDRLEKEELVKAVLELLTEEEKRLVTLYYEYDLTLKEIGATLGVSESRICQRHAEMTRRIRAKLRERGFLV